MSTLMKLPSLLSMLALMIHTAKSQIICQAGEDCIIDCSNVLYDCSAQTINATKATSLTVLCDAADSCKNTQIYTPNSINSTTNIECSGGDSACLRTNVYYLGDATLNPSTHSINIICNTDACNAMAIDVSNAGKFVLDCGGGAQCYNLYISAVNTGIVDITCVGSLTSLYGCVLGQVNAANAGELYVYAGYKGLFAMDIYGQNISTTFEIIAFGTNTSFTGIFGNAEIYIPTLDANLNKFSLNCYGFGCFEMTFIKENGFDNIANANFNVNGCLRCSDGVTDCFSKIYTQCIESGDTSYSSDYFPEPVKCANGAAVCGCDAFATAFWNSYKEDTSDSWCRGQAPTIQPTTMIPTTNEPTRHEPTIMDMDMSSTFSSFMTSQLLTSQPSTVEPTTNMPTTNIPTTDMPTTIIPTERSITASSTFVSPSTSPTKVPVDIDVDQSAASSIFTRKKSVPFFCVVLYILFVIN